MQEMPKSQNIGYLVPAQVVQHFLDDVKDGKYDGFIHLGLGTQKMQNKALRSVYKMKEDTTGIMVMDISKKSSVHNVLKMGDILLSVDGHNINNDGSIEFMEDMFTSYMYYIDKKQRGESVSFSILRDGKTMDVTVSLDNIADDDLLVNTIEHDKMPRYFIYGGYVFTPLSRNLLMRSRSTLLKLRDAASKWSSDDQEEVVILLKVLADKSNQGDHSFALWMVDTVDKKPFKNFEEFKELIINSKEKYAILENSDGVKVAIDKEVAQEVEKAILKRYSIKSSSNE